MISRWCFNWKLKRCKIHSVIFDNEYHTSKIILGNSNVAGENNCIIELKGDLVFVSYYDCWGYKHKFAKSAREIKELKFKIL